MGVSDSQIGSCAQRKSLLKDFGKDERFVYRPASIAVKSILSGVLHISRDDALRRDSANLEMRRIMRIRTICSDCCLILQVAQTPS